MDCTACKGSGQQTITVIEHAYKDKPTTQKEMKIECVWCHGVGTMTAKQKANREYERHLWCCCKEEHEQIFKDDGECECSCNKHHYHCQKCGKITQIG